MMTPAVNSFRHQFCCINFASQFTTRGVDMMTPTVKSFRHQFCCINFASQFTTRGVWYDDSSSKAISTRWKLGCTYPNEVLLRNL
jgi:hypothetical protein